MRPRPLNAQASYLPSKKSQRASEERIAKINELYENIKREHRDSVVSNNSTSVGSQDQGVDNCIPINNLEFKLPKANHIEQHKVKTENDTISPFRTDQTSTPTASRRVLNGLHPHVESSFDSRGDEEDDDDDLEAELRFTPKLKSRRSLITMRRMSTSEAERTIDSDESVAGPLRSEMKVRKPSRISSLRKTLGDPLPLPYVSKDHSTNDTPSSKDPLLTRESVENKRRSMERKWRDLIARDKKLIEKRFADLRQQSASGDTSQPSISITPEEQQDSTLSDLNKEVLRNREKLDYIINLLSDRPGPDRTPAISRNISREAQFWTVCIIVLILCNIYVYHYF